MSASTWGYEIEEAPEPEAERPRCANGSCTHFVEDEGQYCDECLGLQRIGREEYKRARARGWED